MNIRVLLVDPDAADALFVQDVLAEMSAGDFWHGWATFETIHAATWDEAVSVLANDAIDVILDRKSTRLNSSHIQKSRMPSSA